MIKKITSEHYIEIILFEALKGKKCALNLHLNCTKEVQIGHSVGCLKEAVADKVPDVRIKVLALKCTNI